MSDAVPDAVRTLAVQLSQAWPGNQARVTLAPAICPGSAEQAYAVQDLLVASLGAPVTAWKVGAKSPDGPAQCAPLPASGVQAGPGTIRRSAFGALAIELELAFRLDREFAPSGTGYAPEEVMAAVGHIVPAFEIVSTRYAGWPEVDKLALLADLLSHGGLVAGDGIPYDASYPFERPSLVLTHDGRDVAPAHAANPAGDPRRLVPWLVNHATRRGYTLAAGTLVTTGTYTGMYSPESTGLLIGKFDGLPEISLAIA